MPLFLTEQEISFQHQIRNFAKKIVQPRAKKIDEEGEFPYDILEEFKKNGVFKTNIPKQYGGDELGFVYLCIIMEEISKYCASSSLILQVQETASQVIKIAGSNEQKERFLPKIGTGEIMLAFALTEPKSGSDAQSIRTTAKKVDGGYVLNGTKCFVSNGNVADYFVTFAKVIDDGAEKITCFLIPKNSKGLKMGVKRDKMGLRGSITTEFFMKDVFVDNSLRIGKEGMGFLIALSTLDRTRPMIGAQAVGIAGGAFDYALKYSQKRIQFGKPICAFQLQQKKLAEMITEITKAQLLAWRLGVLKNENRATPAQISMAKRNNVAMALNIAREARQIHGGMGITGEYPIMRHMMNLESVITYEGTHDIHLLITGLDITGFNAFH
jgi:glutaryl-CoA dehydrogenase